MRPYTISYQGPNDNVTEGFYAAIDVPTTLIGWHVWIAPALDGRPALNKWFATEAEANQFVADNK